jgi:Raf kinase inhibitor-like YbhB/YbcL family protein
MEITSSAFQNQGEIPTVHTCEGEDTAPPLAFHDIPNGTKSLALVVDDPDAPDPKHPKMTYVHWVVVDIPPSTTELLGSSPPPGARIGINDWKKKSWGGPCPPIGRHRYFFKLYALDVTLPQLSAPTKPELEAAMKGHVLASAELIGTYQKKINR